MFSLRWFFGCSSCFIIIIGCLTACPALADPTPSLFFTPEELHAVEILENPVTQAQPSASNDIHLGAVFFYAPDDWALWLQGRYVTPETKRSDLQVLEVKPDGVRLSFIPAAGGAAREITLKPYQTYRSSAGDVVEGLLESSLSR